MDYYDTVLGLIPAMFILGAVTTTVTGLPIEQGVIAAGVVSSAIVGHSLFINGPTDTAKTAAESARDRFTPFDD